ncbi:MAG: PAS domain S-box protein [Kiritimatiellae bacterium]|nr:PAS domain S-box protein [Kiritimatiellia bacterium]MDD5520291.1 PAS domain S-box protein [Kiritimatiellia bacterium]
MIDLYKKLLDFTHNGVYRYTFTDGKILLANQGLVDILGLDCKPSELVGKYLKDVMIYTQKEGTIRRTLEEKGEIHGFEYHFKTLKGEEKWVTHDSFKSKDPATGIEVVDAIVEDITDQKVSMEALSRLFAAVNAADESIIITDNTGSIQYVNPCFEKMTGYTSDEITGKHIRTLKSGKHDAKYYENLWATISAGKVWRGHFTNRKKDGTLFEEEAVISPVFDESGNITHFVAVKRDVTQEVMLEKQLLQSQKMEAVGRLAGGVAHDFTNMLTVIIQHANMAQQKLPAGSDIKLHLDEILEASDRVAGLTSQLLAFSNKTTISLRVMDLNKAVLGIEEMLRRTVGEDIHLTIHTTNEPIYVKIDPTQIEQVIVHMAVNSKDAMTNGGQLTVEASHIHLTKAEAVQLQNGHTEENRLAGDFALLSVSDTGCGMSEDIRSRVFEPFFTTKGTATSTGLGLSTVYGIIKRHGGHVTVYSNVNRGTTFTIYFPIADAPVKGTESITVNEVIPRGSETILVAEDNPVIRKVLVGILMQLGYNILEAENGKQSIHLAEHHKKPIQLLMTDIIMPEMDGKTLAEKIKTLRPETKVLFASGYPELHLKEFGVLKDNDVLISKPFREGPVARAIRNVLDANVKN